jgi:F-type H+-transporting ATPase subunit b
VERLLQPDFGLMFWTVVTFLLLVAVLTKAAWKPILDGLNQREGKIRGDLERAETAQREAESLRLKYEGQLADAQKTIQDLVAQARADGERTRAQLTAAAKEESEKILAKGRKDLSMETDRLKEELRKEVSDLSLSMAEKVLGRSVDDKVRQNVLDDSINKIKAVNR